MVVSNKQKLYNDYLKRISDVIESSYKSILAIHNFDHGSDFEIVICKLLKLLLPEKYSICRGHIIPKKGTPTNCDDIVIYDATSFIKVRPIENDLSAKQHIPAEAVYAYIEAKHTLNLDALEKALKQIQEVKSINREKCELHDLGNGISFPHIKFASTENWPEYRNPIYTAIIARKRDSEITKQMLQTKLDASCNNGSILPDLIVAENIVCLPKVGTRIDSPFFILNKSQMTVFEIEMSMAIGLVNMLRAINFICLKQIHYEALLAEALDLGLTY
jgi:hypothetical protein